MNLRVFYAKDALFFADNIVGRYFDSCSNGIAMQIDSVGLQSLYSVRLNDNGRIQGEDREEFRKSQDAPVNSTPLPTDQGEPVDLKNLLASNTTLDQLLMVASQPDKPEIETNEDSVHALPEDVQREGLLNGFVWRVVLYERDRRNAAKRNGVDDVKDLTKEDITRILYEYIGAYAETKERAMEDRQLVQDFMPKIIEKIEYYMRDFLHYNVKYS